MRPAESERIGTQPVATFPSKRAALSPVDLSWLEAMMEP